jgi:hypothetical protein
MPICLYPPPIDDGNSSDSTFRVEPYLLGNHRHTRNNPFMRPGARIFAVFTKLLVPCTDISSHNFPLNLFMLLLFHFLVSTNFFVALFFNLVAQVVNLGGKTRKIQAPPYANARVFRRSMSRRDTT